MRILNLLLLPTFIAIVCCNGYSPLLRHIIVSTYRCSDNVVPIFRKISPLFRHVGIPDLSEYRVVLCSDNVEVNGLSEYRDKIKSRSFDRMKKYPINSTIKNKQTEQNTTYGFVVWSISEKVGGMGRSKSLKRLKRLKWLISPQTFENFQMFQTFRILL